MSAAQFAAAMRHAGDAFLDEVQNALDFVAARGLQSLKHTRQFNNRTGALRASFAAFGSAPYTRKLSADTPYAHFVEFGTSRMRAHPYMRDARSVVENELPDAMAQALRRATSG